MNTSFITNADVVVSSLCSSLIIILVSYIFIRVNRRLSLPFIVILSLYLLPSLLRMLKLTLNSDAEEQIRALVNSASLAMLLFALQYFIFELAQFKIKMDSATLEDYNRRLKIGKILKYVMLSISFMTSFAKIYIEYVEPDPFKKEIDHF